MPYDEQSEVWQETAQTRACREDMVEDPAKSGQPWR